MKMWTISYRQRFQVFSSRFFFKSVANKEVVCSKVASYHCTTSLPCPKDTDSEPLLRTRRSPFRNPSLEHRPVLFDKPMDRARSGSFKNDPRTPGPTKSWQKKIPVLKEQKSQERRRVSPELRNLSLADLSSEWHTPRGETKESKKQNYEILFGVAPCLLALSHRRRKAHKLFVKEGEVIRRRSVLDVCEEARKQGVQIHQVTKKKLDVMCFGRVHQGVCLHASPMSYITEKRRDTTMPKTTNTPPLWLVLDGIQDPMNLGAILRSAYFLGVDRVASSIWNSCPLTPVVSKASSGVMEVFEVYGYESLEDMIKSKVAQGWQAVGTVGAEVEESPVPVKQCSDFHMTKPTLLLMGGEGEGLSQELLSQCQSLLTIPACRDLLPGIDSLNVSVATGILLHSLLSSRRAGQ